MVSAATIEQKNIFFEPMQALFKVINDKVQDINADRRAQVNAKDRQWVFPTTPQSNDENYPRVALIPEMVRFEEFGAGRFVQRDIDSVSGDVKRDKFGRIAVIPLTIGVFVKKGQKHEVVLFDGTTSKIQNSKQSDFIGYLISNRIEKFRTEFFINKRMDIKITGIGTSYVDNDFLWAKNLTSEVWIWDIWQDDYADGGLIKTINQNIITQLV